MVIDEDLKWEPHVQHLTQKLKSALRGGGGGGGSPLKFWKTRFRDNG